MADPEGFVEDVEAPEGFIPDEAQQPRKSWLSTVFTPPLTPSGRPWVAPPPDQSLFGISPDLVPRGTTPATSALSAIGKTAAGVGQFITSPQGITEAAAAATPAAPYIMAKWAYDMARGGYGSTKSIVDELGQMANEALNRGIINANQLGPIPEGTTTQEHIQSLAENAANAITSGLAVTALASHGLGRDKVAPTVPEPIPEAPKPPAETVMPKFGTEISAEPEQTPEIPPEALRRLRSKVKKTLLKPYETGVRDSSHGQTENPYVEGSAEAAAWDRGASAVQAKGRTSLGEASQAGEAPPSVAPAGESPTAPAVSAAEVPVAAGTEPATVEPTSIRTTTQPELVGLGGAEAGEIPETGAGGEKYGVAERIRAERAKAGQVVPVEPGKGMSTQQTIAMGRDIVRRDPEAGPRILEAFENDPKKATSTEGRAVVRAHGESLAAGARTVEETHGTMSPQYEQAKAVLDDWDTRSKKMDTEFQKQGMAMQGETDIDTGSFTGLERARKQLTGKDIPEPQKPRAKKIAKENKDAQQEVANADARMKANIRQKKNPTINEAEKRAFDAANRTVRNAAAALAEAENKSRVAKTVRDKSVADVQKNAAQRALDAANKRVKDMASRVAAEERKRQADPSIPVWERANFYLDENKGLYNFDDITNKVATDLKMDPQRVKSIMARDQTTKRLANDLWIKQRNARRLKEQAKNWLRELDTPGYIKALSSIPRGMFSLSTFGHGFVALGTHAPIVAFQPRFWNAYVRNFGKMYKMVFSPTYYESQMADLVRRDNYGPARQSGLQNDPFHYEEFHTSMIRDLVKDWIGEKNMNRVDNVLSAGNRGYGVLKLLRQDMWDQKYNALPDSIRKQEGVKEALSKDVNHATGVTQKAAPKGANIALFAPRLAGSRVMWLAGDPAKMVGTMITWKNASVADKVFAKNKMREIGWVTGTFAGLLAANQGFLAATGSKQKINGIPEALGGAGIDPLASDFLKFKVAGSDIAYGGALLTMTKLPVRVAYAIAYEGKGSKYVLEDERALKVVGSYLRSQASPFAGTMVDLALGRDYEERPLPAKLFGTMEQTGDVPKRLRNIGVDEPFSWPEFAGTKLPIPMAEGLKEGLRMSGMSDEQANHWMIIVALHSLLQAGTGTRITEDTREE